MSTFDDPNRECVGLAPIWSETGDNVPDPPPPEGRKTRAKAAEPEPSKDEQPSVEEQSDT